MPRLYLFSALDDRARRLPSVMSMLRGVEAGLLRTLLAAARSLPPDRASDLGGLLGRRLGPRQRKHRHVLNNLAFVRPDWTSAELEETARGVWENAGRVIAEMPHLATIGHDLAQGRIEVVEAHEGRLDPIKRGERPAIFVGPHIANWDLGPIAAHRLGIPLSVVYTLMTNPTVERIVTSLRRELRAGLIPAEDGGRAMLAELHKGRSIGLLTDLRFDEGEMVPFFGVPTPTAVAPARIAVKLGIDFIPVRVERLERARFRITAYPPITPDPALSRREAARGMILAMNRLFEQWIRERPEQWLCTKRRWPKDAVPVSRPDSEASILAGAA